MFALKNYNLYINDRILFENLNLNINPGEIHVLMGKNGVGKSSIAKSIMGDANYTVKGSIIYNNEDITNLSIDERSRKGIYLLNQSPMAIEGVTNASMLRTALGEREKNVDIFKLNKELLEVCEKLELDKSFIHKDINVGASGGERKKIELMHLWILKPTFIILDEIDSGLDVDALKIVGKSLKEYYELYHPSILIITHSNTLINNFDLYHVHLLDNKKIIKSGGKELAHDILTKGFKDLDNSSTFVIRKNNNYE